MTVTDKIFKILDRKIVQNKAQYDLDRKAAKKLKWSLKNEEEEEEEEEEEINWVLMQANGYRE